MDLSLPSCPSRSSLTPAPQPPGPGSEANLSCIDRGLGKATGPSERASWRRKGLRAAPVFGGYFHHLDWGVRGWF